MTGLPKDVSDTEVLGRAVFDQSKAERARKDGTIPPRVFLERIGVWEISVDRLSFGGLGDIAAEHDRARGRMCHGWASVTASNARKSERKVMSDPTDQSPYHALIVLPDLGEDDDDPGTTQREHAVELALAASWVERPATP